MKILIVTPLQEELDFFLHSCAQRGLRSENSSVGKLPVVRLPELNIALARGGTGKAQFAVHTRHLLDADGSWELVICAGAAGALANDLAVGDVAVATATIEHDFNNKFGPSALPRFDSAPFAVDALRRAPPSGAFGVQFGIVASGDEDVVDDHRRNMLREDTGAVAVAWEGAGGARACAFSHVPFVEIRGITDTANSHAPADFERNLETAMNNVAVLIQYLSVSGVEASAGAA